MDARSTWTDVVKKSIRSHNHPYGKSGAAASGWRRKGKREEDGNDNAAKRALSAALDSDIKA